MFITKKALSRRTVLRGVGATIALPLLDAMVPALTAMAQTAAKPIRRLGCVYHPIGYIAGEWVPARVGERYDLSPTLSRLAPVRDYVTVLSGLDHLEANSKGDGNNDHGRATAVWLTGVHAYVTGASAQNPSGQPTLATTIDQIAAKVLGKDTPLPSLELALESATQISCDSGDCFYHNAMSWRTPTMPLTPETHPRVVFERLFGDGGTASERAMEAQATGSILDSVTREVAGLERALGSSDRTKLTEYLDAVRQVEHRIQNVAQQGLTSGQVLPEGPVDIPDSFEEHARLMWDLQVLAYQGDITRVFTMMMGRELSPQTFPQIGLPEQHHSLSHHLNNPVIMGKKAKIDQHMVMLFGYFLEKLRATPDGDGTLLDHSLILYGGGLGNPNLHQHDNLPCLLAGRAAGQLKGSRHLTYPAGTPMANVLLTVLDMVGVPVPERIGDSTQALSLL